MRKSAGGVWVREETAEERRLRRDASLAEHRKAHNKWLALSACASAVGAFGIVFALLLFSAGLVGDAAIVFALGRSAIHALPSEPKWKCPR